MTDKATETITPAERAALLEWVQQQLEGGGNWALWRFVTQAKVGDNCPWCGKAVYPDGQHFQCCRTFATMRPIARAWLENVNHTRRLLAALDAAERERDALAKNLWEYGGHTPGCMYGDDSPCDCGWDKVCDALAGTAAAPGDADGGQHD